MEISLGKCLIVETRTPGVHVVRFAQPDLREQLCDDGDIAACELYLALHEGVLAGLAAGERLVLNFGLVEPFTTAFYRFLLKVREDVRERQAHLVLCRLGPEHREIFELFKGFRLFQVTNTEAQALRATSV
jgi:anti-anti-sigma regulatory factor